MLMSTEIRPVADDKQPTRNAAKTARGGSRNMIPHRKVNPDWFAPNGEASSILACLSMATAGVPDHGETPGWSLSV